MRRRLFATMSLAVAMAGCAQMGADERLHHKLRIACEIYERPVVQIALALKPQTATVKAALDPYVMPLCRDILAATDPSSPDWVMQQARKVR